MAPIYRKIFFLFSKPKHLILLLLCCYLAVTSTVDSIPLLLWYDEKRFLASALLVLITSITLLFLSHEFNQFLSLLTPHHKILLVVFFILGLINSTSHDYLRSSLLELNLFILLFIGTISVAIARQSLGSYSDKIMIAGIALIALMNTTIVLTTYTATLLNPIALSPHGLFNNYINVRFFNQLQSWLLPLIVLPLIIFKNKSPLIHGLLIFIAASFWMLLFLSGSRGALLSVLCAIAVTQVIFREQTKTWARWQTLCAIGGFLFYLLLFYVLPLIVDVNISSILNSAASRSLTSAGRWDLWLTSWQIIQSSPLLGLGPMGFACDPALINATNPPAHAHPHNSILQIAAEWGVIAAAIMIYLAIRSLQQWVKFSRQSTTANHGPIATALNPALFASMTAAGIYSLFSGVIVMPLSQIAMVLIIGWTIGIYLSGTTTNIKATEQVTHQHVTAIRIIILIALGGFCWAIYPDLLQLTEWQATYLSGEPLLSRFWQRGNLCH